MAKMTKLALIGINICAFLLASFATTQTFSVDPRPLISTSYQPTSLLPITAQNASHLKQLGLLARGRIGGVKWSPDGRFIIVNTEAGTWLYPSDVPDKGQPLLFENSLIALSSNSKIIAVWSMGWRSDFSVWLFDSISRQSISVLKGHTDDVNYVVFSPDGTLIATTSKDGTLRLWETKTAKEVGVYRNVGFKPVGDLAFSPDGAMIVAKVEAAEPTHFTDDNLHKAIVFLPHEDYGGEITFIPGTTQVFFSKPIQLWDWKLGEKIPIPSKITQFWEATVSPDGKWIAGGLYDAYVWNLQTGEDYKYLEIYIGDEITDIKFSPNGKMLVATDFDGIISWWDTTSWERIATPSDHTWELKEFAFSPDSKKIVTIDNGQFYVWNTDTKKPVAAVREHAAIIHDTPLFSPNSRYLAVLNRTGGVSILRVWDLHTGELILFQKEPVWVAYKVTFDYSSTFLIIHTWNGIFEPVIQVWDITTVKLKRTIINNTQSNNLYVASSPNAPFIAYPSNGYSIRVQNLNERSPKYILAGFFTGHNDEIRDLEFNPSGTILASASRDSTVRLWSMESGKLLQILPHSKPVDRVLFTLDGQTLLSYVGDTMFCWNVESGQLLKGCSTVSHRLNIWDGFNSDESLMFKSDALWDLNSGQRINLGPTFSNWAAVAIGRFSPDNKLLALIDQSGTVRLLGVGP